MADDDEVVVTIDDTLPPGGDGKDDPAAILKQQYQELQASTERDRQRAVEAESRAAAATREAAAARQEVQTARVEIVDSQFETVTTGIEAAKTAALAADQEYEAAFERGDAKALAIASRKQGRAEAELVRLEETKADLEARKKAGPDDAARREVRTSGPDPVDAYIANRTEPTANWLRDHREWITDPRKNAKLTAAHYSAQAEGIEADTPEYFEHVENFIGIGRDPVVKQEAKPNGKAVTTTRRPSVPVAPVQPSGGGVSGGGTQVTLSRSEAATATDGTLVWNYDDTSGQKRYKKGDPIGIQEMARRKAAMTKQGAYDRSFTES